MRRLAILLAALAGCSGGSNGPDEAAVHARMEQQGQSKGHGDRLSWDYHGVERGRAHDATAAEAQTGGIPQGTTVWPVRVSATYHFNSHATEMNRDFLFYQVGEDRHWIGVDAPNGTTDRYR